MRTSIGEAFSIGAPLLYVPNSPLVFGINQPSSACTVQVEPRLNLVEDIGHLYAWKTFFEGCLNDNDGNPMNIADCQSREVG